MILRIDDVIAGGKTKTPPMPAGGPGGMGGMPQNTRHRFRRRAQQRARQI